LSCLVIIEKKYAIGAGMVTEVVTEVVGGSLVTQYPEEVRCHISSDSICVFYLNLDALQSQDNLTPRTRPPQIRHEHGSHR
jgi:hypothetical protein